MLPDWLLSTFVLLPALLWMFLGVGGAWALALLPRSDWRKPITVIGVALALGPAMITVPMFLIGTLGQFSAANVLIGSAIMALIGGALALRNRAASDGSVGVGHDRPLRDSQPLQQKFNAIDFLLIAVIVVSVLIRFWNTAYWPYTTYDEFWVYGYNAKIFMLRESIPSTMGYYPQLVPLSYTFMQLIWGAVNDHAARTVVPVFALASILMAYLLGSRLFNRRVGLLTAAIWALYPHHAAWSQFGDLEVPTTLYFTATVMFFALAWKTQNRRYALLSGVMLGAALWTKPTSGALIESLCAITVVIGTYAYITRRTIRHPLAVNGLTALAAGFPMGGMWYIRNVLYGHPPLVFPDGYWQSAAQRSGQELGWPLLIAAVLVALLLIRRINPRLALAGLLILLVGALPSAFGYRFPTFDDLQQLLIGNIPASVIPSRLGILEYGILAIGAGLLLWAARPLWQKIDSSIKALLLIIAAFIVPYFVTWFWSYSYHPRLSFAIVPSMIVLLALLLDRLSAALPQPAPVAARWGYAILIVALALPGYLANLTALEPAITGAYPVDDMKYMAGNQALMGMVYYLRERRAPGRYPAQLPRPMRVEAPGELRLPFFFPNDDIRTERYPTQLDDLRDVDFFIDSSVGQRLYNERHQSIRLNQILSSMTRDNIMRRVYTIDDHNFRFSIYDLDLMARFAPAKPNGPIGVQIGDFAYLAGYDIVTLSSYSGAPIPLTLHWQALGTPSRDYRVFVEIVDPNSQKVVHQFGGEPGAGMWSQWYLKAGAVLTIPYPTHLWQLGEWIRDEWRTNLPDGIPPGIYEWRVGLVDPTTGQRLPVTKDGKAIGDSVKLVEMRINMPN